MNELKQRPFDPAEYLLNEDEIGAYLSEALISNDPAFKADAFQVVARARILVSRLTRPL